MHAGAHGHRDRLSKCVNRRKLQHFSHVVRVQMCLPCHVFESSLTDEKANVSPLLLEPILHCHE